MVQAQGRGPGQGSQGGNLCVFHAHTCEGVHLCASCECMYVCMEGLHLSVRGAWCMHIYEGYAHVYMCVSRGRVCLSAHPCVRVCVLCTHFCRVAHDTCACTREYACGVDGKDDQSELLVLCPRLDSIPRASGHMPCGVSSSSVHFPFLDPSGVLSSPTWKGSP